MKKTIYATLIWAIALTASVQAQHKQFTLKGQLSGKYDSVFVDYTSADGKYTHAADVIKIGAFSVSGSIDHPTSARIMFKKSGEVISREKMGDRMRQIYLEPGELIVTGNPAKLAAMKISGSKTQVEYDDLVAKVSPIRAEMKPVLDEYYAEKDHEKQSAIRDKFEPFNDRIKKVTYAFFLNYPTSYVTLDQMKYNMSMSLDSIKRVYSRFNPELKDTPDGKAVAKEIKDIESGSEGATAFVFSRNDINGNKLSLADFKGKYVMLDFWASWCVPCRQGNPHMIALYNTYKSKGFDIIGIADDDGKPDLWKVAVAKDNVGIWHHVMRGLNMDMIRKRLANPDDLDQQYGIHSIPTKILIDPNGKIIGRYGDAYGGSDADMDKMLASIFK